MKSVSWRSFISHPLTQIAFWALLSVGCVTTTVVMALKESTWAGIFVGGICLSTVFVYTLQCRKLWRQHGQRQARRRLASELFTVLQAVHRIQPDGRYSTPEGDEYSYMIWRHPPDTICVDHYLRVDIERELMALRHLGKGYGVTAKVLVCCPRLYMVDQRDWRADIEFLEDGRARLAPISDPKTPIRELNELEIQARIETFRAML